MKIRIIKSIFLANGLSWLFIQVRGKHSTLAGSDNICNTQQPFINQKLLQTKFFSPDILRFQYRPDLMNLCNLYLISTQIPNKISLKGVKRNCQEYGSSERGKVDLQNQLSGNMLGGRGEQNTPTSTILSDGVIIGPKYFS